ncbi:MAG: SH3 domain-containing protein [archaeon]|nr:SH3 domain-containing protein [archaeon]
MRRKFPYIFQHLKGATFPTKKVMGNMSPSFVKKRKDDLEAYIKRVTQVPELFESTDLKLFIQLEQAIAELRRSREPGTAALRLDAADSRTASNAAQTSQNASSPLLTAPFAGPSSPSPLPGIVPGSAVPLAVAVPPENDPFRSSGYELGPEETRPMGQALFDFEPRTEMELQLRRGDVIVILKKNQKWTKAQKAGQIGYVPTEFLRPMSDFFDTKPAAALAGLPPVPNPVQPSRLSHRDLEIRVAEAAKRQVSPSAPRERKTLFARALYDFQPESDLELAFSKDAIITVLRRDCETGWWEGELDGLIGTFPSGYCEVIDLDGDLDLDDSLSASTPIPPIIPFPLTSSTSSNPPSALLLSTPSTFQPQSTASSTVSQRPVPGPGPGPGPGPFLVSVPSASQAIPTPALLSLEQPSSAPLCLSPRYDTSGTTDLISRLKSLTDTPPPTSPDPEPEPVIDEPIVTPSPLSQEQIPEQLLEQQQQPSPAPSPAFRPPPRGRAAPPTTDPGFARPPPSTTPPVGPPTRGRPPFPSRGAPRGAPTPLSTSTSQPPSGPPPTRIRPGIPPRGRGGPPHLAAAAAACSSPSSPPPGDGDSHHRCTTCDCAGWQPGPAGGRICKRCGHFKTAHAPPAADPPRRRDMLKEVYG